MTRRLLSLMLVAVLLFPSASLAGAAELVSEAPAAAVGDGLTSIAAAPMAAAPSALAVAAAAGPTAAVIGTPQPLRGLSQEVGALRDDGSLASKAALDSFIENGRASGGATAVAAALGSQASLQQAPAQNGVAGNSSRDAATPPLPSRKAETPSDGLFTGWARSATRFVQGLFGKQDPGEVPAPAEPQRLWISVRASTPAELTRLAELGLDAEGASDGDGTVSGSVAASSIAKIQAAGFEVVKTQSLQVFVPTDFPKKDAVYHNYDRMLADMKSLAAARPDLISLISIGKSVEGRDLWALRFNTNARGFEPSSKPGFALFGAHHAREHLSVEVPLKIAEYLASTKDPDDVKMLSERDIWILPMVNPDGAEYDIQGPKQNGSYQMWRKNRRDNGDGTFGVDLNRNYGYEWGTGGASADTDDETYRGPSAFSEPETRAVRDFLMNHRNITILDTKHSFSELHLYPDGYKYSPIENKQDAAIHAALAQKMAQFTGYTPEQSSALYIASGDLTDWSYHTLGVYSFTTELTPRSEWGGGFYPGTKVIQKAYQDNLKADLMLIRYADNPSRVLQPNN